MPAQRRCLRGPDHVGDDRVEGAAPRPPDTYQVVLVAVAVEGDLHIAQAQIG
jgi:hypothetical protein